jgi:hypothetical protein
VSAWIGKQRNHVFSKSARLTHPYSLLAMTFGRPTMVHGPNMVPIPQNVDDEYLQRHGEGTQPDTTTSRLGLFVCSCTLLEILRDVLQFVAAWEPAADLTAGSQPATQRENIVLGVMEINRRLDKFQAELPEDLRINESEMTTSSGDEIGLQQQILRCRYGIILCLSYLASFDTLSDSYLPDWCSYGPCYYPQYQQQIPPRYPTSHH